MRTQKHSNISFASARRFPSMVPRLSAPTRRLICSVVIVPLPSLSCCHGFAVTANAPRRTSLRSFSSDTPDDDAVFAAMLRLEALDHRLGEGIGATKERAKHQAVIDVVLEVEAEALVEPQEESAEPTTFNSGVVSIRQVTPLVRACHNSPHADMLHGPDDRVAIFGGNPAKRKGLVARTLSPYAALDQFGTPRDVGSGDTNSILKKIGQGRFDVVYNWTRFNCHASRKEIRKACASSNTRFVEVASLKDIRG